MVWASTRERKNAEQNDWSKRGRATAVANSNVTDRPRRSVLALVDPVLMNARLRFVLFGLAFAAAVAVMLWVSWPSSRPEPVWQGRPLSYWVTKAGQIEEYNGVPKDAAAAIRAIGPKAVPFLLDWMPHRKPQRPPAFEWVAGWFTRWLSNPKPNEGPSSDSVEFAWWALGTNGRSAIPTLARILNQPRRTMDDYSVWTESAKAISYLGPDAIVPMLTVATNMEGQHELWELLHNFKNLGTNGAPAVPALVRWAKDPDYFVRAGVVGALGGIGERPDLAVLVLLAALNDSNSMVRRDAADALGVFANDSEALFAPLIRTLNGSDWEACGGALTGLGHIRKKPEAVIPLIVPHLLDDNSVVQRSAAYALRDLGSEAGSKALIEATNAPNIGDIIEEVRENAHREQSE